MALQRLGREVRQGQLAAEFDIRVSVTPLTGDEFEAQGDAEGATQQFTVMLDQALLRQGVLPGTYEILEEPAESAGESGFRVRAEFSPVETVPSIWTDSTSVIQYLIRPGRPAVTV